MKNQKRICVAICFGSSNNFTGLQVCLFVLNFNVPFNNFSVMSERSHRFLNINSSLGSKFISLEGTAWYRQ